MSSDWRPQKIDTEAVARDAQLDRIEQKLDAILLAWEAPVPGAKPFQHTITTPAETCTVCGKAHPWRSTI